MRIWSRLPAEKVKTLLILHYIQISSNITFTQRHTLAVFTNWLAQGIMY